MSNQTNEAGKQDRYFNTRGDVIVTMLKNIWPEAPLRRRARAVSSPVSGAGMSAETSQSSLRADPASAWVTHTPKQRAQAANRYDREAREVLAKADAEATQKARAAHVAKARLHVDRFPPLLLRGHKSNGAQLTRDEIACLRDCVKDAWKTLKRFGGEFVTVLS